MHSKIINPRVHGKAVYENKGTSTFLVVYLQHEAKEKGESLTFFNEEEPAVAPADVQQRIDYNVKGLREKESKFIALVLSPSPEELQHIGNDPEKLKDFTVSAMQNYAETFNLKNGKTISSKDLLWFATIHHNRTYKGTDPEVKDGLKRSGELKEGLNMHVHVIVSKRDRAQKITLSPFGNRERFYMNDWQEKNQETFNRMFDYQPKWEKMKSPKKEISPEKRARLEGRIATKVERINAYLDKPHKLKMEKVLEVAERKGYSKTFFYNLNRLENKLTNHQYVRDPMHLLEHNKDRKPEEIKVNTSLANDVKRLAEAGIRMGFTEQISMLELLPKRRKRKRGFGRD